MYQIDITEKADRKLKKLPEKWQRKISQKINFLKHDPFIGKKLHGAYAGQYAARAWPYRIIYTIDAHRIIIHVLDLGHRRDIYTN